MEFIPTTELEAVNSILAGIGETPVESLEAMVLASYPEAELARKKLHGTNRVVQSVGLDCNTDEGYPIEPDVSGYINIPTNVLFAEPSDSRCGYVQRGAKLYDKTNHTYMFTEVVEMNITWFLPFTDLPQHIRNYITVVTKKLFQIDLLGSDSVNAQLEAEVYEAKTTFHRGEINSDKRTILDNHATYQTVRRYW